MPMEQPELMLSTEETCDNIVNSDGHEHNDEYDSDLEECARNECDDDTDVAELPPNQPILDPVEQSHHFNSDIVVKVFDIMDRIGSSQKVLLDVLTFGRDLYCLNNPDGLGQWHKSWTDCIKILKNAGYKDILCVSKCQSSIFMELIAQL